MNQKEDVLLNRIALLCRRDEYMQHLEKKTLARWVDTLVNGSSNALDKLENELEEELRASD